MSVKMFFTSSLYRCSFFTPIFLITLLRYYLSLLEFNVLRYLFFGQTFFVALALTLGLLILLGLVFWIKIFNYNLESNYFLGNFLKVISSALLFWLTPLLLQPILLAIALFFVGDFLTFLFLSVGFFVVCLLFWRASSFLLVLFYSTIFSGISFYAVFMLPLSLIFYLKLTLLKEFFVLVLIATLSYLSFRLGKASFLENHSHVSLLAFFPLFSLVSPLSPFFRTYF